MTESERQELIRATAAVQERRKQLKPVSLRPATVTLVESKVSEAELAYFEALRTNTPTGNQTEVIQPRQALWNAFESDRHPDLQKATRIIRGWYNDRLDSGGGIILSGNYGSGKSHLAKAVWELYGHGAIFWNERRLVETIQGGYGGNGKTEADIYGDIRRAKLLIFDDLGAYPTHNIEWIQSVYYNLFDGRLEEKKATFITTNLALVGAGGSAPFEDRVGGRVFSRLMGQIDSLDYFVDLFAVPDYRKRNFKRNGK